MKRNEIIQNVLDRKTKELKHIEKEENEKNDPLSCNLCDFIGKSKAALGKHEKSKHGKQQSEKITATKGVIINQNDSDNDEFATKINGFLQAVNHLNKTGKNFECVKCHLKFASDDFLKIHKETTHKVKCELCDFKTGNKESMKEHVENPGIWHTGKNSL